MKKVGCIACVVALLLGLGCSSHYIGMQLLPSAYKIFIQPEGGHHSINYDRISIDYDYKINLENMELTFEGQYECKDLLKNIADSYWKDMTLTLEVLFLDGYYKVIDVRHITFFMVGDSLVS